MPTRRGTEAPKVYINGIGAYLPDHLVSNDTVAKLTGIDPLWIQKRTGITRRYLSKATERTSQLASRAVREALAQADLAPGEVDLLLVSSAFPDSFPPRSTAEVVRHKLGLVNAHVVDVNTPLSGFLYALKFARDTVASGSVRNALVVGAESFSAASDLNDRRICYLFSDGSGAVVMSQKKGFAVVGPVAVGSSAKPGHVHWCESSDNDRESFTLYGSTVTGLEQYFHAALETLLGNAKLSTTLHVLSQQVSQRALELSPRPGVQVFDGFTDCAYLLSASLPVSLYHLLRWGEAKEREKAMLFSTDGLGAWCGCLVDLLQTPPWSSTSPRPLQSIARW
ncbi:MAG: hypothetical protein HY815_13440 [Candidatus Riflebacteria bacterium]|nr:hypothetical protein [Candidatus Riflebacteria bacterium]